MWSVGAAHLPGELVRAPHAGGRGVRARFSRVHLAQKWAPERTASGRFSFPPDDDEEFREGRGKRVNRPPTRTPDGCSQREVTGSPHDALLIASTIVDEGRGSSRTQLRSLLG